MSNTLTRVTEIYGQKWIIIYISVFLYKIGDQYGVETKTYAMDFTKGDNADFAHLGDLMSNIRVGVLGKGL